MSDNEESTALEIEMDDDNIEKIHERKSLLSEGRRKAKSPSCRTMMGKVLLISFAGILFILMMVELWADYGTVVQTQTLETLFPPKVYSVTETCPEGVNGTITKEFNALSCEWSEETVVNCTGLLPPHPVALPYVLTMPDAFNVTKEYIGISWTNKSISECVRLIVWSI